ncbi:MAG: hypothetical protein ABFD82_21555 [Syntrophaceae bacterium]
MKIPKLNDIKLLSSPLKQSSKSMMSFFGSDHIFFSTSHFHHMLRIEKKRAERSHKPFLLVLFDISDLDTGKSNGCTSEKLKKIIISCSRETDIRGWFKHNMIIGTIYTEMASVDESSIETIFRKLHNKIGSILGAELVNMVKISIQPIAPSHVLPPVEQVLPDKTKGEETRKESETFSQPFIYNEIAVY